jgi:hypothetical protein
MLQLREGGLYRGNFEVRVRAMFGFGLGLG